MLLNDRLADSIFSPICAGLKLPCVRGQKGRNYIFGFPKQMFTMHSADLKENDGKLFGPAAKDTVLEI
jgi:hypothetical protein